MNSKDQSNKDKSDNKAGKKAGKKDSKLSKEELGKVSGGVPRILGGPENSLDGSYIRRQGGRDWHDAPERRR